MSDLKTFGPFSVGTLASATGATAFIQGIPPWPGAPGNPNALYSIPASSGKPSWWGPPGALTKIKRLEYYAPADKQTIVIMRPKNFTTVTAAVAAGASTINIAADPGILSTKMQYPIPGGNSVSCVADAGIAGGDYYAVQLADGTWFFDKVSSYAAPAVTTTTAIPSPTASSGTGILSGAPFFFFGTSTRVNPLTGMVDPTFYVNNLASAAIDAVFGGQNDSVLASALWPGDPLIVYCKNETAQAWLGLVSGEYAPV